MAFFGALVGFAMKNILSHTLVRIWSDPQSIETYNSTLHLQCSGWTWGPSGENFTFPFAYSKSQLLFLELLNDVAYLVPLIPGGYYTDQKGGKRTLISSVFFSSILFLSFPLLQWVANYNIIISQIFFFCMGAATSLSIPSLASIISQWAPPNELCLMASIAYSGWVVGPVLKLICAEIIRVSLVFFLINIISLQIDDRKMGCHILFLWCFGISLHSTGSTFTIFFTSFASIYIRNRKTLFARRAT